jgi:DNA-binding MarR family transcriptional regulator
MAVETGRRGAGRAERFAHMLHATLIFIIMKIIHPPLRDRMTSPIVPDIRTQLLEELNAFAPARQMHAMRHWPAGRLSLIHLNVLIVLNAEGPLPMRGLAEALDVSQASATGIVDRMEQRGLVTRERDAEDRRVVRVLPSETGRNLIDGVADQRRDHLARLLDGLSDEEARGFLLGLRAMHRAREAFHANLANPETQEASR